MDMYQGLYYFFSCTSAFLVLIFVLRLLGDRKSETSEIDHSSSWIGKEKLIIKKIIQETEDIKTFILERESNKEIPRFLPGQFLSFQIGEDIKTYRSYSISGSCENKKNIQVSIKLLPDGVGSSWFHSRSEGDSVIAHNPSGHFSDELLDQKETRIFVAGGIGITPFLSMIQTALELLKKTPMYLFYGARSERDFAFHYLLLSLSKRWENFHYIPVSSEPDDKWIGKTGYISLDLISSYTDITKAHFYFCGPPIMTDKITEQLLERNVDKSKINSEKFVSPTSISEDDIESIKAKVQYNDKDFSYEGKKTILEFLEDEGEFVPYACRSGVCGECKMKCTTGEINSLTDSGLTEDEKSDYFLSCVSWPKTDIKLKNE